MPEITTQPPCFSSLQTAERGAWLIENIALSDRRSRRKLQIGADTRSRESQGASGFTIRNYTVSKSPSTNRLAEV